MKILVIGQGGREHALVKGLLHSSPKSQIFALPGSDGIALEAKCFAGDMLNPQNVLDVVKQNAIDLVVIGPESSLAAGVGDRLRKENILVFGPDQSDAQLESSKIYAKEFMLRHKLPTSKARTVTSVAETLKFAKTEFTPPWVLKADGLAAGKGVVICSTLQDLENHARTFFEDKIFGEAGTKALLEQFITGTEMSLLLLVADDHVQALPLAQDHKRLLDKDEGPNTGGMGCVAPLKVSEEMNAQLDGQIVKPIAAALKNDGRRYRGILYVGLMMTADGPQIIEFNCRWGDPEAQVLIPLIRGDLGHTLSEIAQGRMPPVDFHDQSVACIVLAAPGYPDKPEKNLKIALGKSFEEQNTNSKQYWIHAGTSFKSNQWVTSGGRVLNAIVIDKNIPTACQKAYEWLSSCATSPLFYRKDIGGKV